MGVWVPCLQKEELLIINFSRILSPVSWELATRWVLCDKQPFNGGHKLDSLADAEFLWLMIMSPLPL